MRVALVVEAFGAGVLNAVVLTCRALRDSQCEVTVIHDLRSDTPNEVYALFPSGVKFIYFPIKSTLFFRDFGAGYFKFRRMIEALNADIVHMHSSFAGAFGRISLIGIRKGPKKLYSPHAFKFIGQNGLKAKIFFSLEYLLSFINCSIVCCSESELLAARMLRAKCHLLENSVDSDCLPVKVHRDVSPVMLGSVGRLAHQKDPIRFGSIFSSLVGKSDVRAVWIGGGDVVFSDSLKSIGVKHVDQVLPKDLPQYFSSIDVYIQTSHYEGMPLSVIEAQMMGIPCVVSNVVGNRDVVQHAVTGFLADSDDDFIKYSLMLIENVSLRSSLGNNARSAALLRFSFARYKKDLKAIYSI